MLEIMIEVSHLAAPEVEDFGGGRDEQDVAGLMERGREVHLLSRAGDFYNRGEYDK